MVLRNHVTKKPDYTSTTTVSITTKLGIVVGYLKGLLHMKSYDA